jgi:hypothetical protein
MSRRPTFSVIGHGIPDCLELTIARRTGFFIAKEIRLVLAPTLYQRSRVAEPQTQNPEAAVQSCAEAKSARILTSILHRRFAGSGFERNADAMPP